MDWTSIALTASLLGNVVLLVMLSRLAKKCRHQRKVIIRLNDKVKEYRRVAQFMNDIERKSKLEML